MSEIQLADASEEFVCGTWQHALIYVLHQTLTARTLRRIDVIHDALVKRYPQQTLAISISLTELALPDAEARAVAGELMKKRPAESVVSAVVLEGSGMWSVTGRTLISGMFVLNGKARRNRVFADIDAASRWAGPLVSPALDTEALAHATRMIRATVPCSNAVLGR